jgi:hypothetical protein
VLYLVVNSEVVQFSLSPLCKKVQKSGDCADWSSFHHIGDVLTSVISFSEHKLGKCKSSPNIGLYFGPFCTTRGIFFTLAKSSGTDVTIFKIFLTKNFAKQLAFLTQNKAKL